MINSCDPPEITFTHSMADGSLYRAVPISQYKGRVPILVEPGDYAIEVQRNDKDWALAGWACKDTTTPGDDFPWTWEAHNKKAGRSYLGSSNGIYAVMTRIHNNRRR